MIFRKFKRWWKVRQFRKNHPNMYRIATSLNNMTEAFKKLGEIMSQMETINLSNLEDSDISTSNSVNLVWIGDEYYQTSGTIMSSLYVEESWNRFDWGFVNVALRNGESVNIRPATKEEIVIADKMLVKLKGEDR